jgi:hypothetical protein
MTNCSFLVTSNILGTDIQKGGGGGDVAPVSLLLQNSMFYNKQML